MITQKWIAFLTGRKQVLAMIAAIVTIAKSVYGIEIPADVVQAIQTLVLALIGAITVEDAARWLNSNK